jgi:hypothetical protein
VRSRPGSSVPERARQQRTARNECSARCSAADTVRQLVAVQDTARMPAERHSLSIVIWQSSAHARNAGLVRTPVSRGRQSTLCTMAVAPSPTSTSCHLTLKFPSAVTAATVACTQRPPLSRARQGYPMAQPMGAFPSSADRALAARICSKTWTGRAPVAALVDASASVASNLDLRFRVPDASAGASEPCPGGASPAPSRNADTVSAIACTRGARPSRAYTCHESLACAP